MIDIDNLIKVGWRFLGLKPFEVLRLTYREFALISEENIEKTHDAHEKQAMYAIINAAASRGKGKKGTLPSVEDLYKRTSEKEEAKKERTEEDIIAEQEHAREWLSQFDLTAFDKE